MIDIVNCKDCQNENCKYRGVNLRSTCWAYKTRPRPQTNADRIRSMTDEELAEFLHEEMMAVVVRGWKSWLDWLRQETE